MNGIEQRKADHIDLSLRENIVHEYNYWNDVQLVHNALPEVDLEEIDTRVNFLGSELDFPIIVTAITGGYPRALEINRNLAEACERLKIGMGVGSQRAAIESGDHSSYSIIKEYEIPLRIANIGAPQLITQKGKKALDQEAIGEALEMIDGHCIAVHLNFLQEIVQPEGDTQSKGCLESIRTVARDFKVIAKETGAGISTEVALRLKGAGVAAIDVSGTSGTSFSAIETHRAESVGNRLGARLGRTFREWGIPAPVSLLWAQVGLPLVASGGITNGLDVARGVVLGASCGGMARAVMEAAVKSVDSVEEELRTMIAELKATMFLTGCRNLKELASADYNITGRTRDWIFDEDEVF
jgi:isopentenyl-diphosphate delta-isomerase